MPNYELLKDAYALIEGIPEKSFDLGAVVRKKGKKLGCGTIACAAGWIGLHPDFAANVRPEFIPVRHPQEVGYFRFATVSFGRSTTNYAEGMAELFGLTVEQAQSLFKTRCSIYDDAYKSLIENFPPAAISDKQLFLARLRNFLLQEGQITAERAAELKEKALDGFQQEGVSEEVPE